MKESREKTKSRDKREAKYRAYRLAVRVVNLLDARRKLDLGTEVIAKQLLRSTTSIGANIIEAQAGSSRKDFANFLSHALKSANETTFWLALLRDTHKLPAKDVEPVLREVQEVADILGASLLTLRGKR